MLHHRARFAAVIASILMSITFVAAAPAAWADGIRTTAPW